MIIDVDFGTVGQNSEAFWRDELENLRILLVKYDKAIATLVSGNVAEYTLDTGQNRQTVRRNDVATLQNARNGILCQIQVLESRLKIGGSRNAQMVPGF